MRNNFSTLTWLHSVLLWLIIPLANSADQPNVLFIIADDASCHFGQAYNCNWVKTPHIDKLAKNGITFTNCYAPTSKCAPSRASILTGRNPWQLEEAANHMCFFPAKYRSFGDQFAAAGIAGGSMGKVWGPGEAVDQHGKKRNWGLSEMKGDKSGNPGVGFAKFLAERDNSKPFYFWFGSHYPHRPYKKDSGIQAGKKITDIDRVPAYWPDNEVVRRDMLDYAVEVEAFDAQVGALMEALVASGAAENTVVIVTSDHGMPFPRVKGHTFDDAHHVPMVISWPKGVINPNRKVNDYISFIDLAPTFLDLLAVPVGDMTSITGRSFVNILKNTPGPKRDHVLIGRERNDWGRPDLAGYPVRGIVSDGHLFLMNLKSDRWPCGNEEAGFPDTDGSPTKSVIMAGKEVPSMHNFWQQCFGLRPGEQLFDIKKDPDCMTNVADNADKMDIKTVLSTRLYSELQAQGDPRVVGDGDIFDYYKPAKKDWLGKFEAIKTKQ